ncbi:MAG: peptidoglycan DD-metalloendopeptidase family protein [Patescibacteria group bacterium]|nr:peptidoglycan DD-metalloendopeptidase family protein [Patescibacteria group bacterium]
MKPRIYIFVVIFALCLSFLAPHNSYAVPSTASAVSQKITDLNSQIQALNAEIAQYQDQISQTSEQTNTLANLIKELNLTREKLSKELNLTQKKITTTSLTIDTLNSDIDLKQKSINNSEQLLAQMFRSINQYDNTSMIEKLLLNDSLNSASREYNNILSLNEKVHSYLIDLRQQKEANAISIKNKSVEQQSLTKLKDDLVNKKLAIDMTKNAKDTLLKETQNKESNYKKLLAERQKQKSEFENDLQNYEAQLQFILNPNLLPPEGTSILSWPLDYVYITQLFGRTVAARRLYLSGSHSGVDFRASIGTPVKSMAVGTVVGVGDTDQFCKGASFGKWVFIKYNNGLSSTYGHLSVILAKPGQEVQTGDVVALSGNTGHTTGPHLHVTVYASQGASVQTVPSLSCNGKTFIMPIAPVKAYLDPMLYLPPITSTMIKNDA